MTNLSEYVKVYQNIWANMNLYKFVVWLVNKHLLNTEILSKHENMQK